MAKPPIDDVERNIERSGVPKDDEKPQKTGPVYRVLGDSKIPVAKSAGKLWKGRKALAIQKRANTDTERAWHEALKYYRNDQLGHRRDSDPDRPGNDGDASRPNKRYTETENIVFANVTALVPMLYAKNPSIEDTAENEEFKDLSRAVEHLINELFAKKGSPGINLKPKMRKAVVATTLMNAAWIEVGYTRKEFSSEKALQDLLALSKQLEKAKTPQQIEKIEGKLMALEQSIDMLEPEGPWCKFVRAQQILRDPNGKEEDTTDHKWLIRIDHLPTTFLNAMYGKENKKGEVRSVYEPTYVLSAQAESSNDPEELINNFSLYEEKTDYEHAGYESQEAYDSAKYTRVCYVWDKVTRRVYLYSDEDWTWPIWVWDDPYRLDTFFPFFPLSFHTDPEMVEGKGEVTYYLDQQDAINEMNDEERRIRQSLKHNIVFNGNYLTPEAAEELVNHNRRKPIALNNVPEGMKLSELVDVLPPPSINFPQVFNIDRKLQAIDRIGSVTSMQRGAEFKTNTTNRAIEGYEANTNTRLDERLDAIEDLIGSIGWAVAQMCLQHMEPETVAMIIGDEKAKGWKTLEHDQIRKEIHFRVVGGSTTKPTSGAKKKEALQLGQILGQFASGAPAAIVVALKAMERAFDEVIVTEEDWAFIYKSIEASMQQGGPQQGQGVSGPAQGAPGQSQGNGAGAPQGSDIPPEVQQVLQSLPPEVQQAIGQLPPEVQQAGMQAVQQAVEQGVPLEQAVSQVLQTVLSQQSPQPS